MSTELAYFGGGCFWGVGYMGDRDSPNPTYKGLRKTRHVEVVKLEFDPKIVSYEELAKFFFNIHDPTQKNRQGKFILKIDETGVDVGVQYQSTVFCVNEEQRKTIEKLVAILEKKLKKKVYTNVIDTKDGKKKEIQYWKGEDYHQNYLKDRPGRHVCHTFDDKFE